MVHLIYIHKPAVSPCSQENHWYPAVHQEERGQQGEVCYPLPLVSPGEAVSGRQCPVLGSRTSRTSRENTKGY